MKLTSLIDGTPQDPIIEKMLDENPLVLFSLGTQFQIQSLFMAEKLIRTSMLYCENPVGTAKIEVGDFQQQYGLFWLWTLGAYEVIRTMCQHKRCFDTELHPQMQDLKKYLAELRMPFAKQEIALTGQPAARELSVVSMGEKTGLSFRIREKIYHSNEVMERFAKFIGGIRRDQILAEIRSQQA